MVIDMAGQHIAKTQQWPVSILQKKVGQQKASWPVSIQQKMDGQQKASRPVSILHLHAEHQLTLL